MNFRFLVVSVLLSLAYEANSLVTSGKCVTAPGLANFDPSKVKYIKI